MQALVGAVLRSPFDTRETLPLDDGRSDRACRNGRFECRCKVPRIRAMTKSHHGFAGDFTAEGDCPVGGRKNGIPHPGL